MSHPFFSVFYSLCLCGASVMNASPAAPDSILSGRPDHVNNALTPYFPPVLSQDGGSCGSASRIGYMFTHEINTYRHDTATTDKHIYPTHFTWLLTNSHSSKDGMAVANGVPSAELYGGRTYSKLYGNQDCSAPDFAWMQGYDKWYAAMFNRIYPATFCPYGTDTEEGREFVKNWLWNHCGDHDFGAGGIAGIGVASACKQGDIADDPQGINKAAGLVGQKYVTRWGDGVDHALTIVGYDDRIVFDLDGDSIYGGPEETGAWIIVNSWGSGWANKGFIYCPYKYSFPVRQNEGGAWRPEFYHVRKDYRPRRTMKILMDYSRRSELKLSVGIASDTAALEPEYTVEMEHFKFAGDGRGEKQKQGIEAATPMLGKWADGKLHKEPMEFGYDLTDLSDRIDTRKPVRYFFIIERKDDAIGQGRLYDCSVIDYELDHKGWETPLNVKPYQRIEQGGKRTVVSAVVQGEPFFAPTGLHRTAEGNLTWTAPECTHYPLSGYLVYRKERPSHKDMPKGRRGRRNTFPEGPNLPIDTLSSSTTTYAPEQDSCLYAISALYACRVACGDTLIASRPTPYLSVADGTEFVRHGKNDTLRNDFLLSNDTLFVGETLTARLSPNSRGGMCRWEIPGNGCIAEKAEHATTSFSRPGTFVLRMNAPDTVVEKNIVVLNRPDISARFSPIRHKLRAGDRITFRPDYPQSGAGYRWRFKGADTTFVETVHGAATYGRFYKLTIC